jgi:small basic protein
MDKRNIIFDLGIIQGLIMESDISEENKNYLSISLLKAVSIVEENYNKNTAH